MSTAEVEETTRATTFRPAFRSPRQEDRPFLFASFLASQRRIGDHAAMPDRHYTRAMSARMSEIAASSRVTIACDPEDLWHIWGWIAAAPMPMRAVHYVHVRHVCRGQGIARALVELAAPGDGLVVVTHKGLRAHPTWWGRPFEFVPYWAWRETNATSNGSTVRGRDEDSGERR